MGISLNPAEIEALKPDFLGDSANIPPTDA
jgi:hypothetical protein